MKDYRDYQIAGHAYPMIYVKGGLLKSSGLEIKISDFYMGQYPVSQALYAAIIKEQGGDLSAQNPSSYKGVNLPVTDVNWQDAQSFAACVREVSGHNFRLPSETEWEYAAKGGAYSQGYVYSGSDEISEVAWYVENSGSGPCGLGLLRPNELGLHDMSGNIWEWCEDDWHGDFGDDKFPKDTPLDGSPWKKEDDFRVIRGGSSFYGSANCRVSRRSYNPAGYHWSGHGFRLVFSL